MAQSALNLDSDRRDRIIFSHPLDWQSETAQQRRVSFSHLALSGLAQLVAEGFIEAPNPKQPRIDPAPAELVAIAQSLADRELVCWFEGVVSPPDWQEFVLISAIRFEGFVRHTATRNSFWQEFCKCRTLEISPFLLRSTFGAAALQIDRHPVVAYVRNSPFDLSDPADFYVSPFEY
jgi:hypothetical protein